MQELAPVITPIAILPGVGLLILSTSHRFLAVTQDLQRFTPKECGQMVTRVNGELRRAWLLKNALSALHVSVIFFSFAALLGALMGYWPGPVRIATSIMLALGVAGVCYAAVQLFREGLVSLEIVTEHARGGGLPDTPAAKRSPRTPAAPSPSQAEVG